MKDDLTPVLIFVLFAIGLIAGLYFGIAAFVDHAVPWFVELLTINGVKLP